MKIKTNYLNKLKDLYNVNVLFSESSFIDFRDKLKKIYPKARDEIKIAHTYLNASQYERFAVNEILEINNLDFKTEDKESSIVDRWFIEYKSKFFGIDSILNLDDETSLYSDLSYYISFAPDIGLADELYSLQKDFLIFTKAWIADDLINYIQSRCEIVVEEIKESKEESYAWFKVGLLYATEEMHDLYKECNENFHEIARIKFPENPDKYRPYISGSYIREKSIGSKNIFNDYKKLEFIYNYCIKNKIEMTEFFEGKINSNQGG